MRRNQAAKAGRLLRRPRWLLQDALILRRHKARAEAQAQRTTDVAAGAAAEAVDVAELVRAPRRRRAERRSLLRAHPQAAGVAPHSQAADLAAVAQLCRPAAAADSHASGT